MLSGPSLKICGSPSNRIAERGWLLRGHSLIVPAQNTSAVVDRAKVDVALGTRHGTGDVKKIAHAVAAVPAKESQDLKRLAAHDIHFFVASIRHVEELLLFIGRERDIERCALRT